MVASSAIRSSTVRAHVRQPRQYYWRSFVLLAVAIGLGLVAITMLPSETPAPAPGAFGLVVLGKIPMSTLNIYESQDLTGESVFDFVIIGPPGVYSGVTSLPSVLVDLSYPTNNAPSCDPTWRCHKYRDNPYLPLRLTLVDDQRGTGASAEYSARVIFRGPPLGIDSDTTSVTAELPAVQLVLAQEFLIGAVEVHYTLANASSYDWTTGQRPAATKADDLTWYLNLASQDTATGSVYESVSSSAGAVNQAAQQHEQFLTFLAGALFGVAGGALVGALQEFLDAREEAKKSRGSEARTTG